MQVSVIVPCFNEKSTILALVERVLAAPFDKEVIVVDDGSTDGTCELLAEKVSLLPGVRVLLQDRNLGKGAAGTEGRHPCGRG